MMCRFLSMIRFTWFSFFFLFPPIVNGQIKPDDSNVATEREYVQVDDMELVEPVENKKGDSESTSTDIINPINDTSNLDDMRAINKDGLRTRQNSTAIKIAFDSILWFNKKKLIVRSPDSIEFEFVLKKVYDAKKGHGKIIDPGCNTTVLTQTAFTKRRYPLSLSMTEGISFSAEYSVLPSTIAAIYCVLPGSKNYQEYSFGVQQQFFETKNRKIAAAASGQYTIPSKYNSPREIIQFSGFLQNRYSHRENRTQRLQRLMQGKIITSVRLIPYSIFHGGFIYTLRAGFTEDVILRDNGIETHSFNKYSLSYYGMLLALETQPFNRVKFFVEYYDYRGYLFYEPSWWPYTTSIGTRILFNRFVMDFSLLTRPDLGYTTFTKSYIFNVIPIMRLSGYFGKEHKH